PYGALVVSSLLDETDILHARPKLYVLPDHPHLETFREEYAGLFGMLEDRPKDPKENVPGFMGADDVTRSVGLFRKLYKDNDNRVDAFEFGKARAFDIFIGDWGRHEDNWKWAGYEKGNKRIYYPIPRDRDHAFSRWNGILPYLADREWAMPNVENFDYNFHDIKSLTWPARHLDRLLLTPLDRSDWRKITQYIQRKMTDDVIDKAIASLPQEVQPISGKEIGDKLKSRREQLPNAIDEYYLLLAKYVDIVGSNKKEYVEINRLKRGEVRVRMYKKKGETIQPTDEPIFDRQFIRDETREIRIYGLDGTDIFNVTGEADKSILVRIIGGPGHDEIIDNSIVKGLKKHTLVYDNTATKLNLGSESKNLTSNEPEINNYDRKSFEYNTYFPMPLIYYSSDDGFVASFGTNWTKYGYRKEEYKSKHDFNIRAGTVGNIQFSLSNQWHHILGKWDIGFKTKYGHYFPYYNFFGVGNDTKKDDILYPNDYYKVRIKGLMAELFTEIEIFKKGYLGVKSLFENFDSDNESGIILENVVNGIPGNERIILGGINTRFYLD
ncbi:MAG: hypothetical protein KAU83_08340, partial [Bacteroidales bacterium]|nr:hypothetical protein [Bacteroidales bacterium]